MSNNIKIPNDHKVVRHKRPARLSHWLLVICFFVTGLSGLAFFFPDFSWLTEIFGTPQLARKIHPFTGIVMFCAFWGIVSIYWRHNFFDKNDWVWLKNVHEVLKGNEHAVSDNGKYNMGQKMLFWTLILAMFTLLVTGIIMWREHFSDNFSIQTIRWAILLHSTSAFLLFTGIMVHIYMAFWVKGSIRGMVEGWVTVQWAKKHHPRWWRETVKPEVEKELQEKAQKEQSENKK